MPDEALAVRFFPFQTCARLEDRVPPFDLFIQREGDDAPILFLSRSAPFDRLAARRLAGSVIQELWIRERDRAAFYEYLNQNIPIVIRDARIPVSDRCSLTYDLSIYLIQKVFESVDPEFILKAARDVVRHVIEMMFTDREAAKSFIAVARKDYHLYTHSINVCLYGMALARKSLNISKEDSLLYFGPGLLLHDIGKLQIAPEILEKTDPLTDEEYKQIMEHPQKGLAMAERWMDVSEDMRSMILRHHERLDGSGYPEGLQGSAIPIPARICAIADAFDAITTNRSFQERRSSFDALAELKAQEIPQRLDENFFRDFVLLFRPIAESA
jgi:HD-GYP domain-containing protein (c-di-GMP phosphodiesterase class II)